MNRLTTIFFATLLCGCQSVSSTLDGVVEGGGFEDNSEETNEELLQAKIRMLLNKPIKELVSLQPYAENLFIGSANHQKNLAAYDSDDLSQLSIDLLKYEYSYATPANDFKQSYIHPTLDEWNWEKSDDWINYASQNNTTLRLHAPISPQCSSWVAEDDRTAEELEQMLEEYMTALCQRYNGVSGVKWLDVVNETIATKSISDDIFDDVEAGGWFGPREGTDKWQNPWVTIGSDSDEMQTPLYIGMAFDIANQYAPDMKQIVNQHGAFEEVVWSGTMKYLINYLEDTGRRVDGVGWQAHIDSGWELIDDNLERLAEFVDWCHSRGLEFHITEMNVYIYEEPTDELYEAQAETFAAVVRTLLDRQSTGVVGINFWHVLDSDASGGNYGCIWSDDGVAKPALESIKSELVEKIINQ